MRSWRGMGYISANYHCRYFKMTIFGCLNTQISVFHHIALRQMATHQIDTTGRAAQFSIDLHAQVGVILRLVFEHMVNIHALRNNTISAVSRLLDSVIHVRVPGGQDKKHNLWTILICISHRGKELLHRLASVGGALLDDGSSIMNLATMTAVNLDKFAYKGLNRLQRDPVQYIRRASKAKTSKQHTVGDP